MFPSDVWISDPNAGKLYKYENEAISMTLTADTSDDGVVNNGRAILVSQNMADVYLVNKGNDNVSLFTNGQYIRDIAVGKTPVGICEDGNGAIYVSNYGDNTVSKIVGGKVVATITVHAGPYGLIANSRNRVYVACSRSNKGSNHDSGGFVDEIVNNTVTSSIEVGYTPRDVACDNKDTIYVANYGSNTISVIRNSVKTTDIVLPDDGCGPCALVCNSEGVLFVANYLRGTVNVIKDMAIDEENGTINVGSHPTAIDVTKDDTVYVLSETDSVMTRIAVTSTGMRATNISVCDDPSGFGDFTGCKTYNVYHHSSKSSATVPDGGWQIGDFDQNIQNILNQISNGTVLTTADKVAMGAVGTSPTVYDAIMTLMSTSPEILKFEASTTVFEYGSTVSSLQASWKFNKPMAKVEIKNGSATIATLGDGSPDTISESGTQVINGFAITDSCVLTMVATDTNGAIASKTLQVKFLNKMLFGAVAEGASIGQVSLGGFAKSGLIENPYGIYFRIDCGDGNVPAVAIPSDWGVKADELITTAGFVNDYTVSEVSYTNTSGGVKNYTVFRFDEPQYGEVVLGFVKVIQ